MKIRILISLAIVVASLAVPVSQIACKSTLEPGGAYAPTNSVGVAQPDRPLLAADSSFHLAYTAIDTVFKLERDNRKALWKVSPEIKRNLDLVRPRAVAARDTYFRTRAIYLSVQNPGALADLQSALATVVGLSKEATALLPK